MKIDVYCHFLPEKYLAAFAKKAPRVLQQVEARNRAVTEIATRIRLMDRYPDVYQVLTIANPPLDYFVSPEDSPELARLANDELAEVVIRYPNKFLGAVACLPLNNIEASLDETDQGNPEQIRGPALNCDIERLTLGMR